MRRIVIFGVLTGAVLAALAEQTVARQPPRPPPYVPPGPERAAAAQLIVVGKIDAIETDEVIAPFATIEKARYRVAVLTVTEVIKGPKDLKAVRLAFVVPPANRKPGERSDPWYYLDIPHGYAKGDDGLFYLGKHSKADLCQATGQYDYISRSQPEFKGEVGINKLTAKLGSDLAKGLQSDSADERYLAAAALILRYRTKNAPIKEMPIAADESKRILTILSAGDWKDRSRFGPIWLFNSLNLTDKDGWTPPNKSNEYEGAAQDWLRKNMNTYRIIRSVGFAVPAGDGR